MMASSGNPIMDEAKRTAAYRRSIVAVDAKTKSDILSIATGHAELEKEKRHSVSGSIRKSSLRSKDAEPSYVEITGGDAQENQEQSPTKSYTEEICGNFCYEISYRRNKSSFVDSLSGVRRYWASVMKTYKVILDEMKFPIFPEKAVALNHVSAQLWLATFAIKDIVDDLAELADIKDLNDLYITAVNEGEETSKFVDQLSDPLIKFAKDGEHYVKEMKDLVANHLGIPQTVDPDPPPADSTKVELEYGENSDLLAAKQSLMVGNRIQVEYKFDQIKIYMRTAEKRKWYSFAELQRVQRMRIIKEALDLVAASFIKIRKFLIPVLLVLNKGKAPACLPGKSCINYLKNMNNSLYEMCKHKELLTSDELEVEKTVQLAEAYFQAIIDKGHQIARQVYEVAAMTHISYMYVIDALDVVFTPWEDIFETLKGPHNAILEDLDSRDFLKTKYPDVLRKLPIVINKVELSLHRHVQTSEAKMHRRGVAGDAYVSTNKLAIF